ncbi:MAG TPA: endonuclease III [Pyrodictiaceae archaeon]|nr:endonuclease III [Pyrodictiaceae archaeon]HIQ11015.1 endonuclease III [Pyrodictium sp.]
MAEISRNIGLCVVEALASVDYDVREFVGPVASRKYSNIYAMLVAVMLTQNTSDANAFKALKQLEKITGLDPRRIIGVGEEVVAKAIRVAGMYRQRAKRIVAAVKQLLEMFGDKADRICELDYSDARQLLLSLPGVGLKTADVILLMYCRKPAFPVDTHIKRICGRLGLGSSYEHISRTFLSILDGDVEKLIDVHLKLITVGRRYCRPSKPKCDKCPLQVCCEYAKTKTASNSKSKTA